MYTNQKRLSNKPKTFFAGLSIRQLAVLRFYLDAACNNSIVTADQIYTIVNKLGLSYRTINRALRELVAMGALIIVKKQFNGSNWVKIASEFMTELWQREMYNWFSRFPILLVTFSMLLSTNPAALGELKIKSKSEYERESKKEQNVSMSNKATLIQGIREALRRRGFEVTEEESCRLDTYSYPMLQDACNLMKTMRDLADPKWFFFALLRELVEKDIRRATSHKPDAAQQVKKPESLKRDERGPVSNRKRRPLSLNNDAAASLLASGLGIDCAASLAVDDKEVASCLDAIRALEGLANDPAYTDFANSSLKVVKSRYERLTSYRRPSALEASPEPGSLACVQGAEDEWVQLEMAD